MLTSALAFAGVAALINVTPGLDTMLVLRTAIAQGRAAGHAAALGIIAGCFAWGVAAAVGITALLTASHLAYDALRVAGAAYLLWLGGSALWQARSRKAFAAAMGDSAQAEAKATAAAPAAEGPATAKGAPGRAAAFRAGLGTNLLNPKAGIFYMSLIPQFIPRGEPVFGATMLLTVIDVAELALWYWVVSGAAAALGERIRRPAFRRRMEQVCGVAFIGFAASLLVPERP
ncbi:LysE family translocator [Actinomycetota bacterium Odt1-20B]